MTDRATLKARICEAIDRRGPEIVALGETLLRNPELGFKVVKAAALVTDTFRRLGLPYRERLALTGVRADLAGAGAGTTVAVLGELDALVCHAQPDADPATGAAHT